MTPSHATKTVLLSELAELCVDLSDAAVKHSASSTPSTPQAASTARLSSARSISIEVALDLRYEASRLKEWASHAKQHDLVILGSSEDTKTILRDSQIGRIVASLLDQADQFRLLLPETQRETPKLDDFQMALRTACAAGSQTYVSVMSARLSETSGPGSLNEIVDMLSEMNDRLWSFNTALELQSTLGPSQNLAIVPSKPKATTSVITPKEDTEIQPESSSVKAGRVKNAYGEKKDLDWWSDVMGTKMRYAPMQSRDEPMLVPKYAPRKSFSKRIPGSTVTFCEPPPPYTFEYTHPQLECERVKAVIVGNGACGKTSALLVWCMGYFPDVYVPTVFENYVAPDYVGTVGGAMRIPARVEVALWDTPGQEDYDRLRPFLYPNADVLILSYEIGFPGSLDNAIHKVRNIPLQSLPKTRPTLLTTCNPPQIKLTYLPVLPRSQALPPGRPHRARWPQNRRAHLPSNNRGAAK